MPGKPGPPPNRSDERVRRNKPDAPLTQGQAGPAPEWLEPCESWGTLARSYYEAFKTSGMAAYFEQTDALQAWLLADSVESYDRAAKKSPEMLKAILAGAGQLGATEADRRRMGAELKREQPKDEDAERALAAVTDIATRFAQ